MNASQDVERTPVTPATQDKSLSVSQLLAFVGLLVLAQALYAFVLWRISGDFNRGSQFGQSFEPLGVLFSGLALGALVYTIYLQRHELKLQRAQLEFARQELALQREELELSRKELQRSADAQERSERALSLQAKTLATSARVAAMAAISQIDHAAFRRHGSGDSTANSQADELKQEVKVALAALQAALQAQIEAEKQPPSPRPE